MALRKLHVDGDITLYSTGVIARDADGAVIVRKPVDCSRLGMGTGLAVGSVMGLLGGPLGVVVGAMVGTLAGVVRESWMAGVGLDFIEEADKHLLRGKVALVADIDEEWVTPVDVALGNAGGQVFRRNLTAVAEANLRHDVATIKSEIKALEKEVSRAGVAAGTKLLASLASARKRLQGAIDHANVGAERIRQEADSKVEILKLQLADASEHMQSRINRRVSRITRSSRARRARLSEAWGLAKEALAVRSAPGTEAEVRLWD